MSRLFLILRRRTVFSALAAAGVFFFFASATQGQPPVAGAVPANPPSPQAVISALDRMDAWLGSGANGDRWRAYLRSDELRAALAEGSADPVRIGRLAANFSGTANGLELAPFAAVREALARYATDLRSQYAGDLAQLARASRGDHEPISPARFAAVRADLRAKVRSLQAALGGQSSVARGWATYLQLDKLEPHLADNFNETAESLAELDEVLRRFRTNEPGLEMPVFTDVAKAIGRYRALATWAATARVRDSRPVYERFMSDMERMLTRHRERPTIETTRQLARALGTIDALGQSPMFVDAVRQQYARPNILGAISASFVTSAPNRPVDRVTDVRDCILGTSIFGKAHTLGNVQYNLIPSNDSVQLAIHFEGTARSRTVGYNGPVRINSSGLTTFWASKNVTLSEGAFVSSPAVADADTNTNIRSIQKTGGPLGRRLIERIAWKRAGQQKGQAERISSSHTRDRVLREFESTVARDLAAARLRYEQQVRAPLVRRGASPEYLRMSSSLAGVAIETLFATRSQLGAPNDPPPMLPGSDMALQVHESAVNNYLPLALASARLTQETADKPPALDGNVPNWLKVMSVTRPHLAEAASAGVEMVQEAQERIEQVVGAEPEVTPPPFKPFSITLNAETPVSARFDDNRIIIRVRCSLLQSDDGEYRNWDFVVTYEIRQNGNRILLRRVGEIEAFPTGFDTEWPRQLSAEETGFRSVLKKNMNARAAAGESFPLEIPIEPVRLSRFGVLHLQQLTADDGWLTVSWTLP